MSVSVTNTYNTSGFPIADVISSAASANLDIIYYSTVNGNLYKRGNYGAGTATTILHGVSGNVACSADGSIVLLGDWATPTLYTSTNFGASWTTLVFSDTVYSYFNNVTMSGDGQYRVCQLIYTSRTTPYPVKMIISENSGASWSSPIQVSTTPIQDATIAAALSINGGTKTIFYTPCYFINISNPSYIKKYSWTSNPTTGTFTTLTTGQSASNNYYDLAISSDAQYITARVITGGVNCVLVSSDGGTTWATRNNINNSTAASVGGHTIAMSADGTIQYIAGNSGYYYSTNAGSTWTNVTGGGNTGWLAACTSTGQRALIGVNTYLYDITYTSGGGGGGAIPCFALGTRVLTQYGYKAIETLEHNDYIVTPDRRVIDFKLFKTTVHTTTKQTAPYLIQPHAFGHNVPSAPLRLSATHKIQLAEGLWTSPEKAALTNPLVKQCDIGAPVTYYHIECENYLKDNIVTEGMIVESLGTTKTTGGKSDVYAWNSRLNAYTRVAQLENVKLSKSA